jgi:peptide subunit release factor RF-3
VIGIPNHGSLRVGDTLAEDARSASRAAVLRAGVLRRVLHGDSAR